MRDFKKIEEREGIPIYESMEASHYRGKKRAVIDLTGRWKLKGLSVRLSVGGDKTVDSQWIL